MKNSQLTTFERKQKNRLNKIHKLKRENLNLSVKRKNLVKIVKNSQRIYLLRCANTIVDGGNMQGYHNEYNKSIQEVVDQAFRISEKMGANGIKIQRLRTLMKQQRVGVIYKLTKDVDVEKYHGGWLFYKKDTLVRLHKEMYWGVEKTVATPVVPHGNEGAPRTFFVKESEYAVYNEETQ